MKKKSIFSLASMFALLFVAAGCSNEDEITSGTVTIKANSTIESIGDNDTRATLANDGVTPNWEEGDKISVKVDNGTPSDLTLESGATTAKGRFSGTIPSRGTNMYFYYPSSATASTGVDLTNQDGSHTKEMVMFASISYSATPSITFKNKTSILKLNMAVPDDITFVENTELFVKVTGAYSKGVLGTDGNWTNCTSNVINVKNAKIVNGHVSAYVVVIPGSKVKNLRIHVGGMVSKTEYKSFVTDYYTSDNTIAVNKVVAINKTCVATPKNLKTSYTINDYFQWDAYSHYFVGSTKFWKKGSEGRNPKSFSSVNNFENDYATNEWARHCPTYEQLTIMLGNQPYWDTKGGNNCKYTGPNKTTSSNGVWLKKLVYCDISKTIDNTNHDTKITAAYKANKVTDDIRNSGEYFFLPAAGYYLYGSLYETGKAGNYWLSTPINDKTYSLFFDKDYAYVVIKDRIHGYLPLSCE